MDQNIKAILDRLIPIFGTGGILYLLAHHFVNSLSKRQDELKEFRSELATENNRLQDQLRHTQEDALTKANEAVAKVARDLNKEQQSRHEERRALEERISRQDKQIGFLFEYIRNLEIHYMTLDTLATHLYPEVWADINAKMPVKRPILQGAKVQ